MSAVADTLLQQIQNREQPLPLAWNAAFGKERVRGQVLADAFLKLHQQRKYDVAIEGIEAALRNNHAEPWMYSVLALEMTLAKRPQNQIDRVLLSRVDFTAGDSAQMMVTAALMSRFGAYDQAIRICKEAAKRNPLQPSVWGMGRRVADRSQKPEDIIWARAGTIRNVWNEGYADLHAEAATVLEDLDKSLTQSGNYDLADQAREALVEAASRDLRIRISWAGDADLDLIVTEPNGLVCSYKSRMTTNGGALIKQGHGGKAAAKQGLQTEEYVLSTALNGEYKIRIRYISGRVITGKVRVNITRYEGTTKQQKQSLSVEVGDVDPELKVIVKHGRGKKR